MAIEDLTRVGVATTLVGDKLLVFGGSTSDGSAARFSNEGSLIDLAENTSTPLPPLSTDSPIGYPEAITTGDGPLIVGYACDEILESADCAPGTYAMARLENLSEWTLLDVSEDLRGVENGVLAVVGITDDDRLVLRLGAAGTATTSADEHLWIVDVRNSDWRQLPDPDSRIDEACVADSTLVVGSSSVSMGGTTVADSDDSFPSGGGDAYPAPVISTLNLGDDSSEWTRSEPAQIESSSPPRLACGGRFAVVFDQGDGALAILDLQHQAWISIESLPSNAYFERPVWAQSRFLFVDSVGGDFYVVDPESGSTTVQTSNFENASDFLWTGDELLGLRDPDSGEGAGLVRAELSE